jgi:hypothetical protein
MGRLTKLRAAFVLIAGALAAVLAGQRARAGDYSGVALDLDKNGIPGVRVQAIGPDGTLLRTRFTTDTGAYVLDGLSASGPISIRFSKPDRIGTSLDRISADTVGGRLDVVMPLQTQVGPYRGRAQPRSAPSRPQPHGRNYWTGRR